jgi:hypothetical protein
LQPNPCQSALYRGLSVCCLHLLAMQLVHPFTLSMLSKTNKTHLLRHFFVRPRTKSTLIINSILPRCTAVLSLLSSPSFMYLSITPVHRSGSIIIYFDTGFVRPGTSAAIASLLANVLVPRPSSHCLHLLACTGTYIHAPSRRCWEPGITPTPFPYIDFRLTEPVAITGHSPVKFHHRNFSVSISQCSSVHRPTNNKRGRHVTFDPDQDALQPKSVVHSLS